VSLTSPTDGTTFSAPATINLAATAADSDGSVTRVDFYSGSALVGSDTAAPYAITLNDIAAGTYTFTARATDSGGATTTSGAVTVTVAGGAPALPSPWEQRDIGSVGAAGDASLSGSTWTIRGSGADVWGTADAFHLVYQPMTGDGSVIARVASVQNVDQWTKAGVMIRETLTAGSAHAFMIVTPGGVKGLAFQRRTSANGLSTHTSGGGGTAPAWVKLTRSGSTITAFRSADGMAWTLVGSDSFSMAGTVYVGLAITSHADGALASATFDNVSVVAGTAGPPPNTPPSVAITSPASGATFTAPATVTLSANASDPDGTVARVEFFSGATLIGTDTTSPYSITWSGVAAGTYTITARATDNAGAETTSSAVTLDVRPSGSEPGSLPSGWSSGDIGAVGAAGSAAHADGVFTIAGSGADIWDAADEFRFVYRTMTGDGTIVARVDSIEPVHQWTKAGVMIRAALTTGSRHAMMIASPGKGLAFQRRVADNGLSTHTAGAAVTAPVWVRLQRTGSTITASTSANGTTWTVVGSDTIAMPGTVFVGLPVTSHSDGVLATATISSVSVTP
jgi:regulation of enolase protein 1 (concanavalin A-like superfamily)